MIPEHDGKLIDRVHAINWNAVQDDMDLTVWNRVTSNFWLPEKIPLSNDIPSWGTLSPEEQLTVMRVFTGLTLLDTIQGSVGAVAMMPDSLTQHEEAVLGNFNFMERLAGDTELLTPHGWCEVSKIGADDLVMQYDPSTNAMTFVKPTKIYEPEWRDEMYVISSKLGDARQVVSGGHRVYFEEKVSEPNGRSAWVPRVCEARDLAGVDMRSRNLRFRVTGAAPNGTDMSVEDCLKVAIAARGVFGAASRRGGEKMVACRFTSLAPHEVEKLTALAAEAGWVAHVAPSDAAQRGNLTLIVPAEHTGDRCGSFFSWWSADTLSSDWAREFVSEVGFWASREPSEGGKVTYLSDTRENSDFVSAVAALAGHRGRSAALTTRHGGTCTTRYVTSVSCDIGTVRGRSMTVKPAAAQMTYCVQVPSTFLLTRSGGSTVITGNCVHARSYSSIFSTLCSTKEIDEAFRWSEENENLQRKASILLTYYRGDDPMKKKIVSVMLESFLFYSGFYLPFFWASRAKLTNTADIIRLIVKDEAVHGFYIGYKYQKNLENLSAERKLELEEYTYELLQQLYENEIEYAQTLYDPMGVTEDVKTYMRYNANKALALLGYPPLFPTEDCQVNPAILSAIAPDANETHDFFSGSGSSYVIGKAVATEDDDWEF